MFSFLWKKTLLRATFAALVSVFLAGALFVSCENDPEPVSVPTTPLKLQGTWVSEYGEEYVITPTKFTSRAMGDVAYAGKFVNHRADGAGAGYITIRFTENLTYPKDAPGRYYVIHYSDFATASLTISGAFNMSDPDPLKNPIYGTASGGGAGKKTLKEAKDTYTVDNGYFSGGSDCLKLTRKSVSNKLQGMWIEEDDEEDIFYITDRLVICGVDLGGYTLPYYVGEIVKVVNNGANGYIIFQNILPNSFMFQASAKNQFFVLRWKGYSNNSVELAASGSDSVPSGGYNPSNPNVSGGDTAALAESRISTLTFADGWIYKR